MSDAMKQPEGGYDPYAEEELLGPQPLDPQLTSAPSLAPAPYGAPVEDYGAGIAPAPMPVAAYQQQPVYQPAPQVSGEYGPATPQGRSAVMTSGILSIFFGWIGAVGCLSTHGGNRLARANLRSIANLHLTALIVCGGLFLGSAVFSEIMILPWLLSCMVYGVLAIITGINAPSAYDRGEVYQPPLAFPLLPNKKRS